MFKKLQQPFIIPVLAWRLIFWLISLLAIYFVTSMLMTEISIQNVTSYANQAAKTAGEIFKNNNANRIEKLQTFVENEVQESKGNISYAVIIDTNVQAIAHSDKQKLGKIYTDDYTISAATKGITRNSKFYADVQKIWTYDIMVPIMLEGKQIASLDIGFPIAGVDELVFLILQFMILVSLVFLVLVIILQNVFLNPSPQFSKKLKNFLKNLSLTSKKDKDAIK